MFKKTHFLVCTFMALLTGMLAVCVFFGLPEFVLNATAVLLLIVVSIRILAEVVLWISKLLNKVKPEENLDRMVSDLRECTPLFLTALVAWFVIIMAKFYVSGEDVFYLKLAEKIPTAILMAITVIVLLDLVAVSVFNGVRIPGLKMLKKNGNSLNHH